MSDEVQDDNAAGEGSQQFQAEADVTEASEADGMGGSAADMKGTPIAVSGGPSQSGSAQYMDDSKPQTSEKPNSDQDNPFEPPNKQKEPYKDRNFSQLGRGILLFCIGSFIAWMLTNSTELQENVWM